ncbi:MAG TPA: hypothetical protein DCO75_03055 [Fibrobacteres bacterium]|jgi:uncharacterized protein (DUF433 family)|nr:hypothetical protein [Fibrobacterota bacterium]
MDWKTYIDSDAGLLSGKPHVKGTRFSVEFIFNLFSKGWTREQVLENYPALSPVSLNAVFAFASEALHDESLYFLKSGAA